MTRIAILGGTSHIAKNLVARFLHDPDVSLHLFNRNAQKARDFLESVATTEQQNRVEVHGSFENVLHGRFDVVINCTGAGTRRSLNGAYWKWFTITEEYDNLALQYLQDVNAECLYISFSSGMVYGRPPPANLGKDTSWALCPNALTDADYYGIARLHAEAKHRAFAQYNIVDIRIFSFFSRYIDLQDSYFLVEAANAIRHQQPFHTAQGNMVRDYIHPDDLHALLCTLIQNRKMNTAIDAASAEPVDKKTLLNLFRSQYDLTVILSDDWVESPTGAKNRYCPPLGDGEVLGCSPRSTSLQTVQEEMACLINRSK